MSPYGLNEPSAYTTPPTNNVSKRDIRPSLVFRKATGGFRSEWGARIHAGKRSITGAARCMPGTPWKPSAHSSPVRSRIPWQPKCREGAQLRGPGGSRRRHQSAGPRPDARAAASSPGPITAQPMAGLPAAGATEPLSAIPAGTGFLAGP